MRTTIAILSGCLILGTPLIASAQGECPPGSWFCEEDPEAIDEEPDATEEPEEAEPARKRRGKRPVIVYRPVDDDEDAPEKIVIVEKKHFPPPPKRRWKREWGFNLRLEGVVMGDEPEKSPNARMGGLGFSLRYRPVAHFALDAGLDFVGGTDWAGASRQEQALSVNGIVFFNPKNRFQVYALGGLGFSQAQVMVTEEEHWSYFGGQLGVGFEWRVGRKVALNLDMVGFVRGRTDAAARDNPEFRDPETGRATNTSGGGLFRAGVTFYW